MSLEQDFLSIRDEIANLPGDNSADAVGSRAPKLEELYAPVRHAAALDPSSPIVQGSRGAGKSFWAGVLFSDELRSAAAVAYPRLGLDRLQVRIGFSGIGGPDGIGRDRLDACLPENSTMAEAKTFFWATVLNGLAESDTPKGKQLEEWLPLAADAAQRDAYIDRVDRNLSSAGRERLIVYDALDTMAGTWPRRRLLTQALFEVVWATRAFRNVRVKLFLRPDQIEDDGLRFIELPKLRGGAVRLLWSDTDLYGMFFARIAWSAASQAFSRLLEILHLRSGSREEILAGNWGPARDESQQELLMSALAGPYMAEGRHGHKKGRTYEWPLRHLGDAWQEVTPRSFLGLMIAAAQFGSAPPDRVFTPKGIQHGLRAASKTRVDQLQQDFPWIKEVLAPLAGVLLPQTEERVFEIWRQSRTAEKVFAAANRDGYLPPGKDSTDEGALFATLAEIGVMQRRKDGRLDMPDLFRVAAKLLKKGGTAPL